MKKHEANAAIDAAGLVISALVGMRDVRTATKYVAPNYTIKATRQWPFDGRARHTTYIVTVGTPNYLERIAIKEFKAAKEPFPVRKIQLKYWPKKRVKKATKKRSKKR